MGKRKPLSDLFKMDDEIDDTLDEQEEFEEKLVGVLETGKDFEYVTDEKNLMLDAFTILGGNENLVQQMIERLVDTNYSSSEEKFIQHSTGLLWNEDVSFQSPIRLDSLLGQMTPLHQTRLPRLLARALLFCARYQDTQLLASNTFSGYHIMLVSLSNLPGSDLPLGQPPLGKPCSRLAVLFHWADTEMGQESASTEERVQTSGRIRTFSSSLAMERKILSISDVFAIIPCP